ncbi:MAG: hypothetical protein LBG11_03915 [Bifidobacteriaceae bacterium]|jgi:hypothetical protein|nr:hypothetical protein [Bifidobacteriaceae bacterium]
MNLGLLSIRAAVSVAATLALGAMLVGCGPDNDQPPTLDDLEEAAEKLEDAAAGLESFDPAASVEKCAEVHVGESCEVNAGFAENAAPTWVSVTLVSLVERPATSEDRQLSCDGTAENLAPVFEAELLLENQTDIDTNGREWLIDVGLSTSDDGPLGTSDRNREPLALGPGGSQTVTTKLVRCPPYDGARIDVLFGNSGSAHFIDVLGDRG